MRTVRTVEAMRSAARGWRAAGGATVALVPTMGALHDGHLSLVRLARAHATHVIATIFVNPTQFGAGEDLAAYPRDEARDAAMLAEAGSDLLFAPGVAEMYPPGFATEVRVTGLTDVLCGKVRPGHFDGVAQVVTKYLNQAQADLAIFGEKDWQQLAVIRRLAADLDIPTRILGGPVVREPDGLAMSSRNRYLMPAERAVAPALHAALARAAARIAEGADPGRATAEAAEAIRAAGFRSVDYVEARDAETLALIGPGGPGRPDTGRPARVFGAAHLGRARLIDNLPIPVLS